MHELDLVPQAYRRWLSLRRSAMVFGVVFGAVIVCLLAARLFLSGNLGAMVAELEQMRGRDQALVGDLARLTALRERERELATRADVLERLRGGLPSMAVFETIDASMDGRVWFREWSFKRAGEYVPAGPTTVNVANIIVVPQGQASAPPRAWKMENHMEIQGQALDHGALADFVRRLASQPLVADVRLLDTRSRRYTDTQVIDFRLAVVLAAGGRS